MKKIYRINGGNTLTGVIPISGSKNATLPIIAASILVKDEVILHNVPDIKDIKDMIKILEYLNVKCHFSNNTLSINSKNIINKKIGVELTSTFRASYYLMGALISLFDEVIIGKPGGCKIGDRPIDQHILGFSSLGIDFKETESFYILKRRDYKGNDFSFTKTSLGASINVVLACLGVEEEVNLSSLSFEPEFIDFLEFLKTCGYNIFYDIDNKTASIERGQFNNKIAYQVMYDRLEAGSYAVLGALIGKNLLIKNFDTYHLKSLLEVFDKMEVNYSLNKEGILISSSKLKSCDVIVGPFPEFCTDLQQVISILMIKAEGTSSILDPIFPNRCKQLEVIGHDKVSFEVKDKIIIHGPNEFHSGYYEGKDLRGTMALLIYSLSSKGVSYLDPSYHLERGYNSFYEKLKNVGASIYEEEIKND